MNKAHLYKNGLISLLKQFFWTKKIVRGVLSHDDGVYYQGHRIKDLLKFSGLCLLIKCFYLDKFEKIALNHGVKRLDLQISKTYTDVDGCKLSNDGVVWDYRPRMNPVIEHDEVIKLLQDNFQVIKSEYANVLEHIRKFPDSDDLTNETGLWAYAPLFNKDGTPNSNMQELCEGIYAILDKINLNTTFGFCMFSILKPNTKIEAHCGSTSFRQRYHLGVSIPEPQKSKIRILDRWIHWEEGRAFGFNDSFDHEVIHEGERDRVILIVDTWPKSIPQDIRNLFQTYPKLKNFGVI